MPERRHLATLFGGPAAGEAVPAGAHERSLLWLSTEHLGPTHVTSEHEYELRSVYLTTGPHTSTTILVGIIDTDDPAEQHQAERDALAFARFASRFVEWSRRREARRG